MANLRAYAAVSLDLMMRWVRPLHPDANLLPPVMEPEAAPDYFFSQRFMCALPLSPNFCLLQLAAVHAVLGFGIVASTSECRALSGSRCALLLDRTPSLPL